MNESHPDPLEMMSPEALSEKWQMPKRAILNLIKIGALPYCRLGGHFRIPREAAMRWQEKNVVQAK